MVNVYTLSLKRFLITGLTVLYLVSCKRANLGNNKQTNTAPASVDTSTIAIIPYSTNENLGFKNIKPASLTNGDIPVIESALKNCLKDYHAKAEKLFEEENAKHPNYKLNKEDFIIDLKKYKRQYVVVTNDDGEKEVLVNCFCETSGTDWKKEIIMVDDGGNCYFSLKINLTTGKYHDLIVNGYA